MRELKDYSDALANVDELIRYYFKCSFNELEILEDGLYYAYDTSFHGSPHYQYRLITNDEEKIKLFKLLMELRDQVLKNNK